MPEIQYPIAHRHRVPPKKSILQSMKSRLKEIPTDRKDYAVVLDFDGIYELVASGTPVSSAEGLKSASAMIFVDVRPIYFDVGLELPCKGYVERRNVTVRFESRVIAPELVLQDRIENVQRTLEYWTRAIVSRESAHYEVVQHEEFLSAARQAVSRSLMENPPVSPAAIELLLVDVSGPLPEGVRSAEEEITRSTRNANVRIHNLEQDNRVSSVQRRQDHEQQLEDAAHAHDAWTARQPLEDEQRDKRIWHQTADAARLEEAYRRGPEAVLALMASTDPSAMEKLVVHGIEDRNFLAELLMKAAEKGVISNSVVEDVLADVANSRLLGTAAQLGSGTLNREIDQGVQRGSTSARDSDDKFDPEDESLDDQVIDLVDDENEMLDAILGKRSSPEPESDSEPALSTETTEPKEAPPIAPEVSAEAASPSSNGAADDGD